MNAKQVLSKITSLLNLSEEVKFTEAKSANGDILSSPTFDLNEDVEVVSEDGTKSPAPDGEYTISLKDESGNENIIRIDVKDGKIVERANEEEEKNEEAKGEEEMEDTPLDTNAPDGMMMAKDYVKAPKGLETDEAHALPMGTDEDPRNRVGSDADDKKDPIISLSYRISELEKMYEEMMAKVGELTDKKEIDHKEAQETVKESNVKLEEEIEGVPALDGAPVEMSSINLSALQKANNSKREGDYQSSFLSKLYK
jgi:hypothetical protein